MKTFREFKTVDEAKKTFDRFYSYFSIIDKIKKDRVISKIFSNEPGDMFEYRGFVNYIFNDSLINLYCEVIDKNRKHWLVLGL